MAVYPVEEETNNNQYPTSYPMGQEAILHGRLRWIGKTIQASFHLSYYGVS